MAGAGDQGVLVVATGTVATLGKREQSAGRSACLPACHACMALCMHPATVHSGTAAAVPGLAERKAMAAAFAQLPARVLWRLSNAEVPDDAALAELRLGNNTKAGPVRLASQWLYLCWVLG